MHGTEQMIEQYYSMEAQWKQACARVDELEKANQELDRDFVALTAAYSSIYTALDDLEHAVLNVRADISKEALDAMPKLSRAGLDITLSRAKRALSTQQPVLKPYRSCSKNEFCARAEGHEGECDDIPF